MYKRSELENGLTDSLIFRDRVEVLFYKLYTKFDSHIGFYYTYNMALKKNRLIHLNHFS